LTTQLRSVTLSLRGVIESTLMGRGQPNRGEARGGGM
jgi:hypothetical protein